MGHGVSGPALAHQHLADAAAGAAHFDALHRGSADPWGVFSRWYERRKRELILAALPREHYGLGFEPGCSVGGNTRALAARCDTLVACDASPAALARTHVALGGAGGLHGVRLELWTFPHRWPATPCDLVVVADACTDATEAIARAQGCATLRTDGRCVGAARAAGARYLLEHGARWLCCTDADSRVPPHWITAQLGCDSDAVCGTIAVGDWQGHPPQVARAFHAHYQARDGHRHIHGANLGVSAAAYRRAGGFAPAVAHEDVRLVQSLLAQDAHIAWVREPRVLTSARRVARAPEGFAAWLNARAMAAG